MRWYQVMALFLMIASLVFTTLFVQICNPTHEAGITLVMLNGFIFLFNVLVFI